MSLESALSMLKTEERRQRHKDGIKINFLSADYQKKYDPQNHVFMEIDMYDVRFRIDFGFYGESERPSIHIIGPAGIQVDHHSLNSLDVFLPTDKDPTSKYG